MLKMFDKLKIQNKIKCELCIYKYKKPNYYCKYIVILGKSYQLIIKKKLRTCIKNSLKWTNPNYKLIKILNIYIYIYIYKMKFKLIIN